MAALDVRLAALAVSVMTYMLTLWCRPRRAENGPQQSSGRAKLRAHLPTVVGHFGTYFLAREKERSGSRYGKSEMIIEI